MNADPRAFGELLNYIADHGIEIWFDGAGMHWRADEEDVDAEFLRLLRRFREPLRQAYGPEILPAAESDDHAKPWRHGPVTGGGSSSASFRKLLQSIDASTVSCTCPTGD